MSLEIYVVKPIRWRPLRTLGLSLMGTGVLLGTYLAGTLFLPTQLVEKLDSSQVLGVVHSDPSLRVSEQQLLQSAGALGLKKAPAIARPATFTVSIPRLNLRSVPVKVDVNGTNKDEYMQTLKTSAAHFGGTAMPGEFGNAFVFAHSSIPLLATSAMESIFTDLPKLQKGDLIKVQLEDSLFTYEIFQTGAIEPDEIGILAQPKDQKYITVMTCIPPGLDSQRFVAVAILKEEVKAR